jgi:hypothetical protein
LSLFNQIAEMLAKQSLTNAVGDGVNGALSSINSGISQAFGGGTFGNAVANVGTGMAANAARDLVNRYAPTNQRAFNAATGALGDILSGDFNNAGLRLFDSGLLYDILPGFNGIAAQARFWGTPTPLYGGITPAEAKKIYTEIRGVRHCKKNLFLIEVSSALAGNISQRFNLFATELEFAPYTISGEKKKIGAGHADIVNSGDPVEMRVTTLDDQSGFLKLWFAAHCQAAVSQDGTVGVPEEYAIKIKVVHGVVTSGSNFGAYEDKGLYRPANIDISLSRREDGLQELQLTFVQLDTFMQA